MFGKRRTNKIQELERQTLEAEKAFNDANEKREALMREHKALTAEKRNTKHLRMSRRLEIDDRRSVIATEVMQLKPKIEALSKRAMKMRAHLNGEQRRLKGARHVMEKIRNPSPWMDGQYSPAQLDRFEQKAQQTIAELT